MFGKGLLLLAGNGTIAYFGGVMNRHSLWLSVWLTAISALAGGGNGAVVTKPQVILDMDSVRYRPGEVVKEQH